jgi:hypothetical protein
MTAVLAGTAITRIQIAAIEWDVMIWLTGAAMNANDARNSDHR